MKTIDHDPKENEKPMVPDFDRAWVHKKYGKDASWVDMLPLIILSVALFLMR